MTTTIFVLVVLAILYRTMTPEAREDAVQVARLSIGRLQDYGRRELDPVRDALRARTRWAIVAPGVVLLQAAMLVCTGGDADPATLVAWGANFGPRTTNGEWWRLVTATFVHAGFWSFIVNAAALLQVGLILERLAGPLAFFTAYLAAASSAGFATIWMYPTSVGAGGSAAVYGLYGLLLVTFVAGRLHRSDVTIPAVAVKRLAPISAIFVVFNLADTGTAASAELVALSVGVAFGVVVASEIGVRVPSPRRIALTALIMLTLGVLSAFPLRGMIDVGPEIQRLVAVEHRTADAYETAVRQFRNGKTTATALVALIERSIVPELQAADARIAALHHVPPEDQERMDNARLYLRLRRESWRLRAETLRSASTPVGMNAAQRSETSSRTQAEARHRSAMITRGKAETAERAAMDALDRSSSPR